MSQAFMFSMIFVSLFYCANKLTCTIEVFRIAYSSISRFNTLRSMQDLIRHLPAAVYEYVFAPDGDHRFNFVSEKSVDILGVTADELTKNPGLLRKLCFPSDIPQLLLAFSRESAPAVSCRMRSRMQVNDKWKPIEFMFNDEIGANGVILRRGIIQEVHPDEEIFGDEWGRYEALLEKLPIGVVIHQDGTVKYANTHAHQIMATTTPGQLIGLNAFDFVHPDYLPGITDRIRQIAGGEVGPMMEEKFFRVDGALIDVETMAFPFSYKNTAAIQVIFRDITEKKKTEMRIRRNETLLVQLFQNIPTAVVMLDDTGKVSGINRGFEQMFGYNEEELKGRNLNDFIVPENLQNEGIDLNNLINANQVVSVESIRNHRSGKLINVILYGVPVMQDNHVISIYGVYVDITDRKKVEEELKVRNAELDNFVYKVSHDLRAPLSSVLGLVNLSRLQDNKDNPMEYMELIGEKIMSLDNFIGDVLSHSKNLKMEVDIERVDLRKIIGQTFTDLGYLNGARKMKRTIKIEGIEFYSDQWRISEIFRNLISNAIKYCKQGSDESEIIIKINVDHLCADISFADNGIGIKPSSLSRIFEMFYRATDQSEGSGIGLYIVKNAVEKLGGQIKVASTPGEGTRFHILLPNRINNTLGTPAVSRNSAHEDH